MVQGEFKHLFTPIRIKDMELKNRVIMAPMATGFANSDDSVSERMVRYYERRAAGGVALVSTGLAIIDPSGRTLPIMAGIYHDRFIPGWKRLAHAVHRAGAKFLIHLNHGGWQCRAELIKMRALAPSGGVSPVTGEPVRKITEKEIEDIAEKFGEGARRAKEAGADAVEILGAMGMLVHQFMSPRSNKRNDAYGGSLERRMKFPCMVVERVREKVGDRFPVFFRMPAFDGIDGGITLDEAKVMARMLEIAGVDVLHVVAGPGFDHKHLIFPPADLEEAWIADSIAAIRETVGIPVVAAHRIVDPSTAEDILGSGKADIVALGRELLADPDWCKKVAAGKAEEIRRCIACNQGCINRLLFSEFHCISCLQNPEVGREGYQVGKAENKKKVLIIGGGVAGLECALSFGLRGHSVTIVEESEVLGGQWLLASVPPKKGGFVEVVNNRVDQLMRLSNVSIEMGIKATTELVEQKDPDVVIVATGSVPVMPEVPAAIRHRVFSALDVLRDRKKLRGSIAVIGGGLIGCETADFLSEEEGVDVTIVEKLQEVALDEGPERRYFLMERLRRKGIKLLTSVCFRGLRINGELVEVVVEDRGNVRSLSGFEYVVIALGMKPKDGVYHDVKNKLPGKVVYLIGDALKPRNGLEAISDASFIASIEVCNEL